MSIDYAVGMIPLMAVVTDAGATASTHTLNQLDATATGLLNTDG